MNDGFSMICLVRHFETGKNLKKIHGASQDKAITKNGEKQAHYVKASLKPLGSFNGITYFNTPQSFESAKLLSHLTGLSDNHFLQ